jgi:HlyD family type I secretion membrane fusion protein
MIACPSLDQWHRGVPAGVRLLTVFGITILVMCIGGFGVWAAMAPLDGAVVSSGSFVATGQNKLVQHLEGGILREMLVREGDRVEADQPLLRLDTTAANAKLRRLILRKNRLIMMQARLEAELQPEPSLRMPESLAADAADPEIQVIFDRQSTELRSRRAKLLAEEEVLRKEIAGLQESIGGYMSQVQSARERMALFAEELQDKQSLLARQLIRKTEVFAVERAQAAISGELGELLARIADATERKARAEQQIAQLRWATTQKAIEDLRSTETELDDVQEEIRAARDVVERSEVHAPVQGIVVKLYQHTSGGVVPAGGVILELLPLKDELIIETHINPSEISHVNEGQRALVRLSALNQRLTPMVEGKVIYVSADAVAATYNTHSKGEPEVRARPSYVVRVRLDDQDIQRKLENFRPTPGMPADLFIKTGERTFVNYIMRPVWDSLSRAFREH